jgi:preprotein translocase subunit SecA
VSDAALPPLARPLLFAERKVAPRSPLDEYAAAIGGRVRASFSRSRGRGLARFAARVEARSAAAAALDRAALDGRIREAALALRRDGAFSDAPLAEVFALVRELSDRVTGQRHYPVQVMGAAAMVRGMIAEMATGEGKTLTATLAVAAGALAGLPVHVVTVNDYLAQRDADLMRPLYEALGLTVGVVVGGMETEERAAAYSCDVTYCTNKELTFDYLRDRMELGQRTGNLRLKLEALHARKSRVAGKRLRGLHFAIVDEADSVLIDEARTPLILSAPGESPFTEAVVGRALALAEELEAGPDYLLVAEERRVVLTEAGSARVADLVAAETGPWRSSVTRDELARQALCAIHLFHRDEHYLVRDGKAQIIDEYTGRVMPDRAWSDGLHQMIEFKEGCELSKPRSTIARITYQRFFRRYRRLGGMTGTARHVAAELWRTYELPVASIPTHRPIQRRHLPDSVDASDGAKWERVIARIAALNARGCPVLVGTRSVASSREASLRLDAAGLAHRTLSAAQDGEEAAVVGEAGLRGRITVATNMAGRGTDIKLGDGVAELGGLHVIMVERHDARRIDDQLAGRSGRQGQPGCFQAMLSLEDPLIDAAGAAGLRGLLRRILATGPLGQRLARAAIRRSQVRVERMHARMRADLLRTDTTQDRTLAFSGHSE